MNDRPRDTANRVKNGRPDNGPGNRQGCESGPDREKPVLLGLCINCDYKYSCRLPRPESGVWYCEEYE